jgi:uncharacterized protein (TIGR00297 family)
VATAARRTGSLDGSGQLAAILVGTAAAAAGWWWAALLIAYFVSSSLLTRLGHARKAVRTAAAVAATPARNARQVLANGGVFAAAASGFALTGDARWAIGAAGALAAAAADTWATEVGTLVGGTPRSVLTGEPVAVGMSGGITLAGSLASGVAALLVGVAAAPLIADAGPIAAAATPPAADAGVMIVALTLAGIAGSLVDSFLGAAVQATRWCESCRAFTERPMHDCGTATVHERGLRWMTNDTVNLVAGLTGALAALALAGRTA